MVDWGGICGGRLFLEAVKIAKAAKTAKTANFLCFVFWRSWFYRVGGWKISPNGVIFLDDLG